MFLDCINVCTKPKPNEWMARQFFPSCTPQHHARSCSSIMKRVTKPALTKPQNAPANEQRNNTDRQKNSWTVPRGFKPVYKKCCTYCNHGCARERKI